MQTVTCCYLFISSRQRIKYLTLFRAAPCNQPRLTRRRPLRKSREGTFPNSLTVTIPAFRPSPPKFANFFLLRDLGDGKWATNGMRSAVEILYHLNSININILPLELLWSWRLRSIVMQSMKCYTCKTCTYAVCQPCSASCACPTDQGRQGTGKGIEKTGSFTEILRLVNVWCQKIRHYWHIGHWL